MHLIVLLASILLGACSISAWDPSQGQNCSIFRNGGYDETCPSEEPYCRFITGTVYQCRACLSDCDCALNQYCSNQSPIEGENGNCRTFYKAGAKCFPMSNSLLEDPSINDKLKCAIVVESDGELNVEYSAPCIQGICRMCDPTDTGTTCSGQNMGQPRTCVFPGYFASIHSQYWEPGRYYEEPLRVWLAMCFVLILFSLAVGGYTLSLVSRMAKREEATEYSSVGKPPSSLSAAISWIVYQFDRLYSMFPCYRRRKNYTRFDQYTSFEREDSTLLAGTRTSTV